MTQSDQRSHQLPTLQRLGIDEPTVTSAAEVATSWFTAFSSAVASSNIPSILDLFVDDGFWKDILALTWDYRSVAGRDAIKNLLENRLAQTDPTDLRLNQEPFYAPELQKKFPDLVWVRCTFGFRTKVGMAAAVCHLVPTCGGTWRAYVLFTCLQSLHDFPEQVGPLRRQVAEHGTWETRRHQEVEFSNGDPTVIIVGAGHVGLEIAARLKYLGVSHLVVDKKGRVGDSWRDRYKALCLHDPVWFNQTPYLPFPPTWPVYSPAGKLADWLEGYANYLELNVWTSSVISKTKWDEDRKTWSVDIERGGKGIRVLEAKHLVFATGFVGYPKVPDIPGRERFKGEVIHSSQFTSALNCTGRKAVVVGSGASGHDIAQDCINNSVDITMYQRSSTYVISAQAIREQLGTVYNDSMPTNLADLYTYCLPNVVVTRIQQRVVPRLAQTVDKEILDGLAKVGFKTNFGVDDTGFHRLSYDGGGHGGGYYFDVGTSKHIINGDIKLKSGSIIESYTENGIRFADGTELEADVVIFATGYGDPRDSMREICGSQVADKVNPVWGLTEEGEVKSIWRDCGHERLWFGIGSLGSSRFHSRYLALQIKAIEAGILERSEVKF